MEYGYLLVEGYHEIEYVGRLLKYRAITRVKKIENLDPFWSKSQLIPRTFPYGGDLLKRVPVPVFFQNDEISIAVQCSTGLEKILDTLKLTLANMPEITEEVKGIGVIFDADYKDNAAKDRYAKIKEELVPILNLPDNPGQVLDNDLKSGVYIFPDNLSKGTIETMLLECGSVVYPDLIKSATTFVDSINIGSYVKNDRKDFQKPSGREKAIIGAMGSVLRPGKAIQVSIQDNKWLNEDSLKIDKIKALDLFLSKLFDLIKWDTVGIQKKDIKIN